jgi:uncharacterized protein
MRKILLIAFTLLISTPAQAQDYKTLLDIPEGETLVDLSVTKRLEVEQDLLTANLRYEIENANPRELQNKINHHIKEALEIAQGVKTVKTSTQGYNVYQYNPNQNKKSLPAKKIWRGSQGVKLKSKNAKDLLALVGKIQGEGFTMNGLNYSVSPELLEETRNNLLEAALTKLRVKANRIAKALGKTKTALLHVIVDSEGYKPRAMMQLGAVRMADMPAPVAVPGRSNISLTVRTTALIKP